MHGAESVGIPSSLCLVLHNLLFRNNIIVRSHSSSSDKISRESYSGLPQGSVLSPDLFTIHTLSIRNSIPSDVEVLKYSDDLLMYVSCQDVCLEISRLEEAYKYLSSWLTSSNLSINPSKISAVIFSSRQVDTTQLSIRFDISQVPFSNSKKILGVTLHSQLTWTPHILAVQRSCQKSSHIICSTCRTWWGASPSVHLMLFKSIVRSKMEYASPIYFSAKLTTLYKLQVYQNNALRAATGAFKSSPIPSLLTESGIPPLLARVQLLSDKYVLNQFRC
jgi:hypothetical protein